MTAYYNENDPKTAAWLTELARRGLVTPGTIDTRSIKELTADDLRHHARVHLFAGIGGWDYALQLAGWPDSLQVWTGSCPCQPYSSAGRGKGEQDARHLWPEMFRLIRECRPPVVLGEQVAAAVGHGWLDGVFADLESEGYACGSSVLGAHSVGAPHLRQRLYFAASRLADPCSSAGEWRSRGLSSSQTGERGADGTEHGYCPERLTDGRQDDAYQLGHSDDTRCEGRGLLTGECPGERAAGPPGHWDRSEWIACGDGKLRRIVSRLAMLVDGISHTMASLHPTQGEVSAKTSDTSPNKALQILRQEDGTTTIRDSTGGSNIFHTTAVLQPRLHVGMDGGAHQGTEPQEQSSPISQDKGHELCEVQINKEAACPPRRWKPAEQRPLELDDIVRHLPYAYALATMEGDDKTAKAMLRVYETCPSLGPMQHALRALPTTRRPVDGQEIQRAWDSGLFEGFGIVACSPLTKNFPSRAVALRGFGNAIVPQVAAAFITALTQP